MKRYTPKATRWLAALSLVCGAALLIGIFLAFSGTDSIVLSIALILSGGWMGSLFVICFFAEKSRTLTVDADKILLPRGAKKNGKTVLQKTVVRLCDIRCVKSTFHKGDKIITDDSLFLTLTLKDGTDITVLLSPYGAQAEKEILETIKNKLL